MTRRLLSTALALAATAFLANGASAQSSETTAPPTQGSTQKSSANAAPFVADKAASAEVLDGATAREDLSQVATSSQTSAVSGSSVNGDSVTGDIGFSDNAFQNASGLTVINANSGNNVAMNASLNVNIVMGTAASPPQ